MIWKRVFVLWICVDESDKILWMPPLTACVLLLFQGFWRCWNTGSDRVPVYPIPACFFTVSDIFLKG